MTSLSAIISVACPKCGTIKKSGRRSCCARGGAWFKNCGDGDDTNYDHTWAEGINSCKSFGSPDMVESPEQVMLHNVGGIAYGLNTSQAIDTSTEHMDINSADSVSNADVDSCEHCVRQTTLICIVYMYVWFVFCACGVN